VQEVLRKGEKYAFIRRVAKSSRNYLIVLPRELGKNLHGKIVQVTIEVLEPLEKGD